MTDVTRLLDAAAAGDRESAAALLPLLYDELRRLAASQLRQEAPGHTLQPTALVHEAYLRLVGGDPGRKWDGRGHFFAAAAEAMRRILIEDARRKKADKRGGRRARVSLDRIDAVTVAPPGELLALDEALERLGHRDPVAGQLVKFRYYAGLSLEQAAEALGISSATAYRHWTFGRAWLHGQLLGDGEEPGG